MSQTGVPPSSVAIAPEERPAAAIVTLVLYTVAGVALAATAGLLKQSGSHEHILLALSAVALSAGPVAYKLQRDVRTPTWALHVLQCFTLAMVAIVVAFSGAARSPYWFYIFFPALFCSYFYRLRVAVVYLLGCVVIHALPFAYGNGAAHNLYIAQFVSAAPSYVALGLAIGAGKRVIVRLRARAEMLVREQSALLRVATAVVDGLGATAIYAMVAAELASLFGCEGAGIMRVQEDAVVVAGAFGAHAESLYREGTVWRVTPGGDAERSLQTGVPVRVDQHPEGSAMAIAGYPATLLAPVTVGDRVWGLLAVASTRPAAFNASDEQMVMEFGALLATAIASAEERAKLSEQALTDPLTGLVNARALHERLDSELARAARHETPLSVAVIDVDHFKEVNDNAGHETGDQMLVRVAAALASFARTEDTLGRLGGDEFAWILPDTTREQALVAVERARQMIARAPADPFAITISAGICDSDSAPDPAELIALADRALYWSKAHGRNQTWIYDPAVVQQLSEVERARRLERAHALQGLRSLVRTVENQQLATVGHSDRVSALAIKLARALGFTREDEVRIGEAAVLHGLGRIASTETASAPLQSVGAGAVWALREQARVSAQMARAVLDPEQVGWIGDQYRERANGAPDAGDLITLADAWDTLTHVQGTPPEAALAACTRLGLNAWALAALADMQLNGELAGDEAVGDSL